jgi:aspartate kinase
VDRAVTSGEIVAASLLALALEQLGVPAVVLDARESGIHSDGTPGEATVVRLRPARVERLIGRNVVPVVTGFQGWHRGRLTALGRGGSDITAVALAGALGAAECELVKDPGALHTADPRLVPEARPIPRASHRFVTDLSGAGARVIHHAAAANAEREGRSLRFTSLDGDGEPATIVARGEPARGAHAVVLVPGRLGLAPADDRPAEVATVTVVSDGGPTPRDELLATAARAGVRVLRAGSGSHGFSFLVPDAESGILLRALHTTLDITAPEGEEERRMYAGHR